MTRRPSRRSRIRLTRDTTLFSVGLLGIVGSFFKGHPDPTLLVLFGGMVGLPSFLRNDENRRNSSRPRRDDSPGEDEET